MSTKINESSDVSEFLYDLFNDAYQHGNEDITEDIELIRTVDKSASVFMDEMSLNELTFKIDDTDDFEYHTTNIMINVNYTHDSINSFTLSYSALVDQESYLPKDLLLPCGSSISVEHIIGRKCDDIETMRSAFVSEIHTKIVEFVGEVINFTK